MGFVSDLFGTESNFQGKEVPIQNMVDPSQLQQAGGQNQNAFNQQLAFVNAMNAQNPLANQQAAFNMIQQQALGQGPNPAMAQLNQTTGQNIAQQAALMGSQRGIGSNPGLLARQAANVGSNIQQQGVGQAATLAANQQLAAQNQMANIAGQQVGQQQQGIGQLNQFGQGNQQALLNAMAQQNALRVQQQAGLNQVNAGVAQQNTQSNAGLIGGLINASGAAATMGGSSGKAGGGGGYAHGGMVGDDGMSATCSYLTKYAAGGKVPGKAQVPGDSLKNDKVKAMLSPGEIVIPRTHAQDPEKAAAFVRAVITKARR